MTLDKAIARYEIGAKLTWNGKPTVEAEECRQLAEWLKDYKRLLGAIDVIKTEIKEERECAYADFERYKVDYLGQDWEDVIDSLPTDEYRYGMERTLEIIEKHTSGGAE